MHTKKFTSSSHIMQKARIGCRHNRNNYLRARFTQAGGMLRSHVCMLRTCLQTVFLLTMRQDCHTRKKHALDSVCRPPFVLCIRCSVTAVNTLRVLRHHPWDTGKHLKNRMLTILAAPSTLLCPIFTPFKNGVCSMQQHHPSLRLKMVYNKHGR